MIRRRPPADSGRHWPGDGRLRRDVRALLRRLRIGAPLDVRVLCERLGEERGRAIRLREADLPSSVSGLWLTREDPPDLILYQRQTTAAHQEHIVLHEIGHVICDHGGMDPSALMRAEQASGRDHDLSHFGYDSPIEREAEMVATVIRQWCLLLESLDVTVAPEESRPARRLRSAFDDHQAWI